MAENWIYGACLNVVSTWARRVAPPEIRRLLAAERLQVRAAQGAAPEGPRARARVGSRQAGPLTRLGGGAFGNRDGWIHAATRPALEMMPGFALDVRRVSYGAPSRAILHMTANFD